MASNKFLNTDFVAEIASEDTEWALAIDFEW